MLLALSNLELRRILFLVLPLLNFVVMFLVYRDNRHTLTPGHRKVVTAMFTLFTVTFLVLAWLVSQAE